MNSKYWCYVFFADLLAELSALSLGCSRVHLFTKPLLVVLLFAWFMGASVKLSSLRYLIAAALFFSWMGDIFLMLDAGEPLWFMAGLGSFLLAHSMYILFFLQVRRRQIPVPKWNALAIAAIAGYAVFLLGFLYPYIANLQLPVTIYAITLATMLVAAIHAFNRSNTKAGRYCIAGAVLFLCSDSLLAVNKFYGAFPLAGVGIMATYGLAQFAIVKGSLLYLAAEKAGRGNSSEKVNRGSAARS